MPRPSPLATYRLQLTGDFGFDAAAKLVPYLKALGISHLYASPFLKARKGSTHGYDIVDHGTLNPEFGGDAAFERLTAALKQHDLGLILDFVPNHMGIGYHDNAWWLETLEWGRQSPRADAFDIAWDLLPYRQGGGVLLPALGAPYGEVLENGDIALRYDAANGEFSAWYFEHRFPINPQRYGEMIKTAVAAANAAATPAGKALLEIAARHPRPRSPGFKEAPAYKRAIAGVPDGADVIERGLSAYDAKTPAGRQALHRLLERQNYRLAHWRVAVSSINYRRFFDVNDLAGVRIEHPLTFRDAHSLVARLISEDKLHGLRIDHIDGLRDPMQYARRLRQLVRQVRGPNDKRPFHVTVEKILGEDEPLPDMTGVAGTTGYEWLNVISRVLVDDRGLEPLERTWRDFTGANQPFPAMVEDGKRRVLETMLASEFNVLAQSLARIAAGHFSTRDYGSDRLRAALEAYVTAFPVYRTYITAAGVSEGDRKRVDDTIAAAKARWPGPDPEIFDFLRRAITLDLLKGEATYSAPRVKDFAFRLQQFTGPMMAKSLEDTTFYRHHRLIALNEVGGEAAGHGFSADEFHARVAPRAERYALGLTATATHDTKRGEDARTRILTLSERPALWRDKVAEWSALNASAVQTLSSISAPSRAHQYMLYQALIGVWPQHGLQDDSVVERLCTYAVKAGREGKQETSWVNPNEGYENAFQHFIRTILGKGDTPFVRAFEPFARQCALAGAWSSLAQLTIKATMPGVPDFYQGTEFWDLSLVDPDNRRPPKFDDAATALAGEPQTPDAWRALAQEWRDGRIKSALTRKLLALRNTFADVFMDGSYRPVAVEGRNAAHIVAYERRKGRHRVVVAVARHLAGADAGIEHWTDAATTIAGWDAALLLEGPLRDGLAIMPGPPARYDAASLFPLLPVAVLHSD